MPHQNRDADRNRNRTTSTDRIASHCDEGESVSQTVVETVAALEDADSAKLPALAEFVDPDALNDLFGRRFDGTRRAVEGRVEFEYAGYWVAVDADGTVAVSSVAVDE